MKEMKKHENDLTMILTNEYINDNNDEKNDENSTFFIVEQITMFIFFADRDIKICCCDFCFVNVNLNQTHYLSTKIDISANKKIKKMIIVK